jgi:hypothetical protein
MNSKVPNSSFLVRKSKCKNSSSLRIYRKNTIHLLIDVPLNQLKNHNNLLRKQILSRVLAFLLLGLFVNALIIQGLHYHHSQDQLSINQSKVEKTHGETQVHSAKISCKLCEVIKQQSHFYDLPAPVSPLLVLDESRELTFGYLSQHSVAYIHSAANKGPPSLLA